MNKLLAGGALLLAFGAGAWSGYQVGSTGAPASATRAGIAALVEREPGLSGGRAVVDADVLRALIRQEMSAVLAARTASSSAAVSQQPADRTTAAGAAREVIPPEKLAQRREAQEQIDGMLSQGVWGNEQRLSFQQKLVLLDPEQRERALQQITTAINNGTLQVNTDGPPL